MGEKKKQRSREAVECRLEKKKC